LAPASSSATSFPDRYDQDIRRAVKDYWPAYPFWVAWKAQLWQESRLNPLAVSPVGARGLAQFMPGTWADVSRELQLVGIGISPTSDVAIKAGAYYMAKLRAAWSSKRPEEDRHRLAQASYNAGMGHILSAQRACGNPALYEPIIACLPQITGRNSEETIGYIKSIARWRQLMEVR
jgi:soluble lytic murein transglycosylase-like protein